MEIYITSVFVDNQDEAIDFYVHKLGFVLKHNVPLGEHRWVTVTGKANPNGPELLLEPSSHEAVPAYKKALYNDGIPAASFEVYDLDGEYNRLCEAGVTFTVGPVDAGQVKMAILDDSCGNLIQLVEQIK